MIGRSRCWARWTRSWRLGLDRPVSTKLRCLVETLASRESSSWLKPRRVRQKRISSPAVWGSCSVWTTTGLKLARHYTRGNRRAAPPPGSWADDRDTGCSRVGGAVPRALERARFRAAPADDRRALDGGRKACAPAAAGDPRDRGGTRACPEAGPRGPGLRGDRGSRGGGGT